MVTINASHHPFGWWLFRTMTIDSQRTPAFAALMSKVLRRAFGALVVVCLAACQKAPTSDAQQSTAGSPPPATLSAPPQPIAAPAPQMSTLSYALFDGAALIVCTDATGPADKIAKFKPPESFVVLKQTCDALGRVELTSCTNAPNFVTKYYEIKHSDQMADCVKSGGQWTTNKSPEAQMARAEQELAKAKKAAGIKD